MKVISEVLEEGGVAALKESQVAISHLLPVCEQDVTQVCSARQSRRENFAHSLSGAVSCSYGGTEIGRPVDVP
ncbi:hypothetical protein, partial [Streptosporangium carneum]|uniref:hypothetical protein n=1 Tax=Streptosporangium carneum TaxID=47481 RepID=UPI0031EC6A6A